MWRCASMRLAVPTVPPADQTADQSPHLLYGADRITRRAITASANHTRRTRFGVSESSPSLVRKGQTGVRVGRATPSSKAASRGSERSFSAITGSRPIPTRSALVSRPGQALHDDRFHLRDIDPDLLHRIAVADRGLAVLQRVDVYRDAPRRADLVLAPVQLADRGRVVVDGHRVPLQVVLDPVAELHDLGPLLEERQHCDLVGRQIRVEPQHDSLLAPDLLLPVGVDQEREGGAVGAGRRLDDPGDEVLAGRLVEILQVLARLLLVAAQVPVAPVVDPLELLPAEREAVLDVDGLLGLSLIHI